MRRALSALLLVAALASSAGAQTSAKSPASVTTTPAAETALPAPLPPLFSPKPPERDIPACKASCAKTYYFCRANADDDSCPSEWSRCNVRCSASFVRPSGLSGN
ncbi:hypothetical protein DMC25_14390 [Caulobacter sp. D4A]|uniref:hypothetical protein n=1 Tax=Caulobacter sp. D4A TaxID=2204171 RepID=UPI000D73F1E0|nr:hypothetical protein [Caulobacter sp. D4A]PXA86209.1 hypothetical protein DMC25_14390 [Caulobacter sp. D4A]PXA88651.1 hypothetical protein DMC18_18765 [Caulobacter sp. D5]